MLTRRIHAVVLAAVTAVGAIAAAAVPARADSEGTWRALTYGLGGLTAYGAVKRSPTMAIIGAAGTAYSYSRWKRAVRDRHRREAYYRYRVRGYRGYYRPGYYRSSYYAPRYYRSDRYYRPVSYTSYRGYPRYYRSHRYYRHRYAPRRLVKVYRTTKVYYQ